MTKTRIGTRMSYGAVIFALSLTMAGPGWSANPKQQSTGPGVMQGEDGSMSTKQEGNTGSTTGRNEQSGSATGTVRDPTKAEPPLAKHPDSTPMDSSSSQETRQTKGQKQSGAHTDK